MDKILSPIKKRIFEYIDYKKITKEYFYKKVNISASNFKGKALKSEIGGDKIANILTKFEDLSPDWLLTGKGKMLRNSTESVPNNEESEERIRELKYTIELQKDFIEELKRSRN